MDIKEKIRILSDAAKYDVSCSSSGGNRKNKKGGLGNANPSGICHSFTQDGRCISLLKILLTNYCCYDCAYCINRISNDIERTAFTPEEIVDITINFYRRNFIEGLFLSSAIYRNPNYTMELLLKVAYLLRKVYKFNGYIHMKAIPGADEILIKKLGELVDRLSVNIELPSNNSLKLLAPQKEINNIIKPMSFINKHIHNNKEEKIKYKNSTNFVPAGQSTQLIVGATRESDKDILNLSENLYNKYDLKRVYYSAFVPVTKDNRLISIKNPPLLREHRLYQADWLLRFYGFSAGEILDDKNQNLSLDFDPKTQWALNHLEFFPIEINKASSRDLLRIPGVGVTSVNKITKIRKVHSIDFDDLKKIGVVLKRAKYFVTCKGKYFGEIKFDEESIKNYILNGTAKDTYHQISLFELEKHRMLLGDV
ncbi:putative DNA modification/repair radical SAM protein [Clostridium sp. MSJ-11]|uniref:DNA modification/repair radical SAM protein n=1 Tax=Clostridium mobile TaxID=2841512 RepID=A0ABS6ECP5_9CLOT|nr:putative DNA modification/repair radical SAM protein [Clostridium mobile]MBU5482892.1 putative DNA modification/repair radical SAM protein [Clostridium mobile]